MPACPELSAARSTLAVLDGAHARAATGLARAVVHRAEVVPQQNRRVATARAAVDRAVAGDAKQSASAVTDSTEWPTASSASPPRKKAVGPKTFLAVPNGKAARIAMSRGPERIKPDAIGRHNEFRQE